MCGIAGIIDWTRDLASERGALERMTETLRRRGPDERGIWTSPHALLGHRRLSVIDPANGQQPMTFEKLVTVYNGELYNFRELRADLAKRGHTFRTTCDTEVVLHAYAEWGAACVDRFDGIFGIAIWDAEKRELFLARDRIGVKPLFYAQRGSSFLFASEIKALLAHPLVPPEVDRDGLAEVLVSSPPYFAPTPGMTPFRGVRELRPGHRMVVRADGATASAYWRLESRPHTDDPETTVARVRELLVSAVRRQLVSDVPLASLLSGGLDSSGVTAIAQEDARRHGRTLGTWSIDFVDAERDFTPWMALPSRDAPFAAEAAAFLGTTHNPVVLETAQMLDTLVDCVRARDMPISSQHDTSLLLLFQALKTKATVALSGEGADEIFGGYTWCWNDFSKRPMFPWIHDDFTFTASKDVVATVNPDAYLARRYEEAASEVPLLATEDEATKKWRSRVYMNSTRFLGYLLARKDRLGMYGGVEGRVPFCDVGLVEYMWNVPRELQRVDGVEKTLLRKALHGYLPDSILWRKKSVFPFFENPAYLEGLRGLGRAILADGTSPALPLFDREAIEARCGTFTVEGPRSWTAVVLERFVEMDAWLREYRVSLV